MKQATNILINPLNAELNPICNLLKLLRTNHILHVSRIRVKVKSCNALLCMLLACIRNYIQLVSEIYIFILFYIYLPLTLYLRKQASKRGYFSKPKGFASKTVWETVI